MCVYYLVDVMRLETKTVYCHNKLCDYNGTTTVIDKYSDVYTDCPKCGFKSLKSELPASILDKLFSDIKINLESIRNIGTALSEMIENKKV
jgi:hypothetical protein